MKDANFPSIRRTERSHPLLENELAWTSGRSSIDGQLARPQRSPISEYLIMQVSEDDLIRSKRSGLNNPLLCALQRHTSTLWSLTDDGFAVEVMEPYRVCQLAPEVVQRWQNWQLTGVWEDFEWTQEFLRLEHHDMGSLIQNRNLNLREINVLRGRAL